MVSLTGGSLRCKSFSTLFMNGLERSFTDAMIVFPSASLWINCCRQPLRASRSSFDVAPSSFEMMPRNAMVSLFSSQRIAALWDGLYSVMMVSVPSSRFATSSPRSMRASSGEIVISEEGNNGSSALMLAPLARASRTLLVSPRSAAFYKLVLRFNDYGHLAIYLIITIG